MWLLASPWALFALGAIPVALGIYFFRTRSRRREVSSLFLWADHTRSQQGGRRVERFQFPLMLLLELLALALLALAAAGPSVYSALSGRQTVVVLDSSYSMTAGEADDTSPQQQAVRDLHRFFDTTANYPIMLLAAGQRTELIAERIRSAAEAKEALKAWECEAPTDSIDAAISLAATIAPADAKLLVVTDRAPEAALAPGKVEWRAFGQAVGNLAIVHASRSYQGEKDRLLIEIANQSRQPRRLQFTLLDVQRQGILHQTDETLGAGEQFRLRSTVPEGVGAIDARIAEDPLLVDNRLTLLPPTHRLARVKIGPVGAEFQAKIERAVEASGLGRIVEDSSAPEIVFTDGSAEASIGPDDSPVWTVRFYAGGTGKEQPFVGPFILDRTSPATLGLGLDGVVWTATDDVQLPGTPIISAGDVPLMTERNLRNGAKEYRLAYRDRLSTLTTHAAWPALVWNLLKHRAELAGGMVDPNVRLGSDAVFIAAARDESVVLTEPDGTSKTLPVRGGRVAVATRRCGVSQIKSDSGEYAFSVGTLSTEESDLLGTASGTYGGWNDEATLRRDYQSIVWALLLAVLLLLAGHLALLRKRDAY